MPAPVHPPALQAGDRVAIVAPAGPISLERVEAGEALLRSWGLDPVRGAHLFSRHGYFAGPDEQRAADLAWAVEDPAISAVLAARGGYGTQRVVDLVDLEQLAVTPKLVLGFSDITALHLAVWRRARLITLHGPSAAWTPDRLGDRSAASLRHALFDPSPMGRIPTPAGDGEVVTVAPGVAEGRLVGGNLALLTSTLGTADMPDLTGVILLLEEVAEHSYRIDRMLTQLHRAGVLHGVSGIVFGESRVTDRPGEQTLNEVLADRLGDLGVPVLYGLPLGHEREQVTVPHGAMAVLDAAARDLRITEPATRPR